MKRAAIDTVRRSHACDANPTMRDGWVAIPLHELRAKIADADPRDRTLSHGALVRKLRTGRPAQRRRATAELVRRYLHASLREAA